MWMQKPEGMNRTTTLEAKGITQGKKNNKRTKVYIDSMKDGFKAHVSSLECLKPIKEFKTHMYASGKYHRQG